MPSTQTAAAKGWIWLADVWERETSLPLQLSGCAEVWLVWKHTNSLLFNKGSDQPSVQYPEHPEYTALVNHFSEVTFQN